MRTLLSALTLSLLWACVPTAPATNFDRADAGTVANPDSGALPPASACDPVAGTGCEAEAGTECVWSADDNLARCQILTGRLTHRDPCYPDEPSCGVGLTCTALKNDETTTCYQVCDPEAGTGCEALGGGQQHFVCSALLGLSHGVCLVAGSTCDPLLDSCGPSETCGLRGGQTTCLAAGEVPIGGDCTVNGCAAGGLCVKLSDRSRAECYRPCDPGQPRCPGDSGICTSLDGQPFGLCQRSAEACTPMADSCVGGTICGLGGVGTECVVPGPVPLGEPCGAEACAPGGLCARLGEEPSPRCREACDLGLPRCSQSTAECYDVGLSFGLCD